MSAVEFITVYFLLGVFFYSDNEVPFPKESCRSNFRHVPAVNSEHRIILVSSRSIMESSRSSSALLKRAAVIAEEVEALGFPASCRPGPRTDPLRDELWRIIDAIGADELSKLHEYEVIHSLAPDLFAGLRALDSEASRRQNIASNSVRLLDGRERARMAGRGVTASVDGSATNEPTEHLYAYTIGVAAKAQALHAAMECNGVTVRQLESELAAQSPPWYQDLSSAGLGAWSNQPTRRKMALTWYLQARGEKDMPHMERGGEVEGKFVNLSRPVFEKVDPVLQQWVRDAEQHPPEKCAIWKCAVCCAGLQRFKGKI